MSAAACITRRHFPCLLIMLAVLVYGGLAGAQATEVSSAPYPVGEIRITREDVTSQSFRLNLTNLNITDESAQRARLQTWMFAGARGRMPAVHVDKATFIYIKDGKETSSTTRIPEQISQSFVRVNDLGLMRQYWTYALVMTTASPGVGGGAWVFKDASLLVELGAPSAQADPGVRERFKLTDTEASLAQAMLLNADISPDYYTIDYGDPVPDWQMWSDRTAKASASGNLFRFSVYNGGFYGVSKEDLAELQETPVTTDATAWRLFKDGQEVPLLNDEENAAGAVFFPVARQPNDGLREQVYWLDTSGETPANAAAPARFAAELTSETAVPTTETLQTTATFSTPHRRLVDYNPRLKADAINDRWVWTDLKTGTPARLELIMPPYYKPVAGSTVRAKVKYGFSNFPPIVPKLVITTTDHKSAETTLSVQLGIAEVEIAADSLRPGKNEVSLEILYPIEAITLRPATIQSIDTEWIQALEVAPLSSYFFESAASTTAPLSFQEKLPANVSVFSFNERIPTLLAKGVKTVALDQAKEKLMLANTRGALKVSNLEAVAGTKGINELVSARSVIIVDPELAEGADALKAMHEARDLQVAVFTTKQLYEIFAYGNQSPNAIRDGLRYLFYRAGGTPPEYVTLVGEASDFAGDPAVAPATVQRNMVPASTSETPEAIQGDEKYAASIGSDLLADFVIGRIPAANAQQLDGYLAKAAAFDNAPPGEWSRRTEFVMDDNDEFPDVVSRVVEGSLSPLAANSLLKQWDYEYVPNMRVAGKKRTWDGTQAVIDSFNQGVAVLNFFGHGGPNLWSHERLFHLSDLPEVKNSPRLPLITCASCDNAWITYPMPPVNASMGELLVLKPDGGAIGLFGPVSGASPYEHSTLVQSQMEGILRAQLRRLGGITFYAKNSYYSITRSASIPEQYLLLGDPTIKIHMPVVEPLLYGPAEELRAKAGAPLRLPIGISNSVVLSTTGTLTLVEAGTYKVLAQKQVMPRQTLWEMVVPEDFKGGCVMALLEWQEDDALRYAGTSLSILPSYPVAEVTGIAKVASEGSGFFVQAADSASTGTEKPTSIEFKVQAMGTAGTSETVEVSAYADGKILDAPTTVTVAGGQQVTTFDLPVPPADRALDGQMRVEVRRADSATYGPDDITTATFTIPRPNAADLEFVPNTARAYAISGNLIAGATVMLEAELRNTGNAAADRVTLQALQSNPTTGTELMSINDATTYRLGPIGPGETQKVAFRWETANAGSYEDIYLVANRNKLVSERNLNNNSILIPPFEVAQRGNFTIRDFAVTPRHVTPGTTVTVSAILENNNMVVDKPVAVELGWERSFDSDSTSTKYQIPFENGTSTFTREMEVPEGYTHLFLTVNSDNEIEETDPGDNTARTDSMIAYEMPDFQKSLNLGNTLSWGTAYNASMPFEGELQVSGAYTSVSLPILPELKDVMSGEATAENVPDDNKWMIAPWRVVVGDEESPADLSLRVPVPGLEFELPGLLVGYILPYQPKPMPVKARTPQNSTWFTPPDRGMYANSVRVDFGIVSTWERTVSLQLGKAGDSGFSLINLSFYPHAIQWDSVPYQVPARLQGKELEFAVDATPSQWQQVYLQWRSGQWQGDDISWSAWKGEMDQWNVKINPAEFVQLRVIAAPVEGKQPILGNFRISR